MVLLIDVDKEILNTYKTLLEFSDFNVITAESSKDAMAQFAAHKEAISIIITDYHMPDTNGIKLIQSMQKQQPSLNAVVLSGGLVTESIPSDITFFRKPLPFHNLITTLQKH